MKPTLCSCGKQIHKDSRRCKACENIARGGFHKHKIIEEIEDSPRATWDTEMLDEAGNTTWALELADRYRMEIIRRTKHRR